MKKYFDKYSILICLIISIIITYIFIKFIFNEIDKLHLSKEIISGTGFGMIIFILAIFIGLWTLLGYIYDKLF